MFTKCELMHIDTANNIAVSGKATGLTCPISIPRLVFMSTYRTLATCSSFGASEALDVGLFGFVSQVVDIPAIFPEGHPLVVVSATIVVADTMRIADEKRTDMLLLAEGNDLAGCLVPHIANTTFCSSALLVLGALQLLPSSGILLASGLLFCHLAQLLTSLVFERSNATTCHDHGLSCIGRDGCEMDFTQVYSCMNCSRSVLSLWRLNTDMQLKSIIPNKAASTAVLRKLKRQDERRISSAHGQDNLVVFFADGLGRPMNRIEALLTARIFHFHLRMGLTELTCGIDVGKEGMHNHLDRLTMQGKLSFGRFLQFIAPRPLAVLHSCLLVDLTTEVPYFCRFHLSSLQASKQLRGGLQSIHTYCIHGRILSWIQIVYKSVKPDGVII